MSKLKDSLIDEQGKLKKEKQGEDIHRDINKSDFDKNKRQNRESRLNDEKNHTEAKEKTQNASINQGKLEKNKAKKTASNNPVYHIMMENLILNSVFRKVILIDVFLTIAALVSFLYVGALTTSSIPMRYVSVNDKMQIFNERSLSDPIFKDGEVIERSRELMQILNNYDYINWKSTSQIMRGMKYFDYNSWEEYLTAFQKSNILNTIEDGKRISSIRFKDTGKIVKQGVIDGYYAWKVELPAEVQLIPSVPGKKTIFQSGIYEVFLRRASLEENASQIVVYRVSVRAN